MENIVKYFFNTEAKIFHKYYFGNITFDDIQRSWDQAILNKQIPDDTIGFIIDYRDASLQMEPSEYQKITKYYHDNIETFKGKKIAVITADPKDLVIPLLVQIKDKGYTSKTFSTKNAALNWIIQSLEKS